MKLILENSAWVDQNLYNIDIRINDHIVMNGYKKYREI